MSDFPSIHLYSQYAEHDDAFIFGTKTALISLRNSIDEALRSPSQYASCESYAADGEGYSLIVQCVSEAYMEITHLPYQHLYINSHLLKDKMISQKMLSRLDLCCSHTGCSNLITEFIDDNGVSDFRCRIHGIVNPARVNETPQFQPIPGWESARSEQHP